MEEELSHTHRMRRQRLAKKEPVVCRRARANVSDPYRQQNVHLARNNRILDHVLEPFEEQTGTLDYREALLEVVNISASH